MNALGIEYKMIKTEDGMEACYYSNSSSSNGVWRNDQMPLRTSLPMFLMQQTFVLFMNHLVVAVIKPLRQPRIVGQVITGLLLGPTIIGNTKFFEKYIFPYKTAMVLETFANMAVVFHMFLVGLEMDINLIFRSGTKALSIALAGIFVPMAVGFGLFLLSIGESDDFDSRGCIFCAVALTATNVPELTEILTDLKLLRLDIGRTALSSSLMSDLCTWMIFLIAILVLNVGKYYAVLSTFSFILFCVFAIRPALSWIFRRMLNGENLSDSHVWLVLAGILFCGFFTDGCGLNSAIGAFMLGVIMPHGQLIKSIFRDSLNDFVMGTWMPLFFVVIGLKSNLVLMFSRTSWKVVLLVLVWSCVGKIVSTFLVSLLYSMPPKEGLVLGLLMNTKGVLALAVLNTALSIKALNSQVFALMILAVLVMTCLIEPIVAATYKPGKQFLLYNRRTIRRTKQTAEFRILACIHSTHNISGMIKLLEVSNSTNQSPIRVFAIHLVELIGHTTATLIMHDGCKSTGNNSNVKQAETEKFVKAFENYEKTTEAAIVQTLTFVSPYERMHEDIFSLAEDKHAALIIIPFHKRLTAYDGNGNYANSTALAGVNINMLTNSPCSVGIFVDRGLSSTKHKESQPTDHGIQRLVMLFTGGPDDREALAYAWRMAGHPKVKLTVVRFLPGQDVTRLGQDHNGDGSSAETSGYGREKQIDDEDMYEFKFKTMNDESISYVEKVVNNGEETVAAIRNLGHKYDLYMVGRGAVVESPLTWNIVSDWRNFPELGVMAGYVLGTFNNLASHASVVVIQKYISKNSGNKSEFGMPDHIRFNHDSERLPSQRIMYDDDDYDDEDDN